MDVAAVRCQLRLSTDDDGVKNKTKQELLAFKKLVVFFLKKKHVYFCLVIYAKATLWQLKVAATLLLLVVVGWFNVVVDVDWTSRF